MVEHTEPIIKNARVGKLKAPTDRQTDKGE
jgi:hypothetical protein